YASSLDFRVYPGNHTPVDAHPQGLCGQHKLDFMGEKEKSHNDGEIQRDSVVYYLVKNFSILELDMVAHTYDPNTKGLGKENCDELQAILGYRYFPSGTQAPQTQRLGSAILVINNEDLSTTCRNEVKSVALSHTGGLCKYTEVWPDDSLGLAVEGHPQVVCDQPGIHAIEEEEEKEEKEKKEEEGGAGKRRKKDAEELGKVEELREMDQNQIGRALEVLH
ncbi:hypothetical protein STEG23_017211, partial [Scotinomys teguina]